MDASKLYSKYNVHIFKIRQSQEIDTLPLPIHSEPEWGDRLKIDDYTGDKVETQSMTITT